MTVLAWAGVAYLSQLNGELEIVDLEDPAFPSTAIDVATISPEMTMSCHDIGLDPVRQLAFCPALDEETYILDVSTAIHPAYVGKIVNPGLSTHHGALMAPDGRTLVLQSEFDHPAGVVSDAAAGLWFYDLTEPTSPALLGSWAPSSCEPDERNDRACTSHWYNFIPGTQMLVASWRHEGIFRSTTASRRPRWRQRRSGLPGASCRGSHQPISGRPTSGMGTSTAVPIGRRGACTSSATTASPTRNRRPMTRGRAGDAGRSRTPQ